jgi:3',5'-cyclic AMP phosphodiesterase CpdA
MWAALFGLIAAFAAANGLVHETRADSPELPRPVTVAFIADQGLGDSARSVLRLIAAEGADLVLHQGDLEYRGDPDAWDDLITDELGADFPYFVSIGNHDVSRYFSPDGYQHKLKTRLNRIEGARCTGKLGVQSACTFKGLFFILSGVGTLPNRPDDGKHVAFIREQLAQDTSLWRICSWHKTQRMMQLGRKRDAVGWGPYEACRKGGAIVANGHEHSYARTHLMSSFESLSVASTSSTLRVTKGRSFAFVSALGGKSIRDQDRDGPWWAVVYTSDQKAKFGALFCTFFVAGEPNRARCYFKDIDGRVADRFVIISDVQ